MIDGPLIRLDGWPARLVAFVETRRDLPFAWGGNDCVTFALGAVQAITGTTLKAPGWTNEDEALRLLVELRGIEAATASLLGEPSDNWRRARRGDVALIGEEKNGGGVGPIMVCIGANLVGPGLDGLQTRPVTAAVKVWRVG